MLISILLLALTRIAPPADIPFRQPQVAASHSKVGMTFGSGSSVFYAASPDGGRPWTGSPARRRGDGPDGLLCSPRPAGAPVP